MTQPRPRQLRVFCPSREGKGQAERAFSLIEVTIAVGITAVALVSLLGMLPQGTQLMKRAADTAIEARIHQQIVSELLLTDWEKRDVYHNEKRGYDDQGIHIVTDSGTLVSGRSIDDVVYQVRIRIPGGDVTLPGGDIDPNLQLVLVDITNRDDADFDFDSARNQHSIHTYQSLVVKMGQNFESTPAP